METQALEKLLNDATDNKYGFRFKGAILEKNTGICFVEMFYNDGVILTPEVRQNAEILVKQSLPTNFIYQLKFIKNFVVDETVRSAILAHLHKNYPSVICQIKTVDCEGENKKAVIAVNQQILEYVTAKRVKDSLENFLQESFYSHIDICFEEDQEEIFLDVPEEEEELVFDDFEPVPNIRYITVSDVEPVVGDLTETNAFYIKDKKQPEENVVFCGKMSFLKDYTYTPKKKDDGKKKEESKAEEEQTPKEKRLYKFVLEGFTGKIPCVIFETKNNAEKLATLEDNKPYIISGKLEEDKFSNGVSLRVKNISKCVLPESFKEEINYKPEPKAYRYVFPEKYSAYAQTDLFSFGVKKEPNKFFLENDIVVFDFETTGLNTDGADKIIEIGAVKVEKGIITEKFMSYVNPEMHIPADGTAIHGIVDADVKDAPTYDKVLADFYKFTRGCYLSGYNIIGFDCLFLKIFGRKSGYNFDNPVLDVYKIAQKEVRGTKNLKLTTVAEKLGVLLDNAHRAVYDAIATAEVLLKIGEYAEIKGEK